MVTTAHTVEIYTDGSCHTQLKFGAWAAIIFTAEGKQTITGTEENTTHNRMEVTAVIKAIEFIQVNYPGTRLLNIYTDSQYVAELTLREEKLMEQEFKTAKGKERNNTTLLKKLLELCGLFTTAFIKVKAHKKTDNGINYNREADMLCRHLVRAGVKGNGMDAKEKQPV